MIQQLHELYDEVIDCVFILMQTGEEKDEAFVAELVENFCNEEQGGMTEIVDACKQFQNGTLTSAVEAGRVCASMAIQ